LQNIVTPKLNNKYPWLNYF